MKRNGDKPRLLTSDEMLGRLVHALDFSSEVLDSSTARRLFEAGNLTPEGRLELYDAFTEALFESGVAPDLHTELLDNRGTNGRLLSLVLVLYAQMWDGISGAMSGVPFGSTKDQSWSLPFIRLVTIDLAIRLTGFLRQAGINRLDTDAAEFLEKKTARRVDSPGRHWPKVSVP